MAIFDGKAVIARPLVRIEKEVQRANSGAKQRSVYVLTVTGTLLPHRGSPMSDGSFHTGAGEPADEVVAVADRMASLRNKQGALCRLFCAEGKWLEFQPPNGTAPIKCQPRLRSGSFSEGVWVDRCDYAFVFEADTVHFGSFECCAGDGDGTGSADPVEESWDLEQADDAARTYRLTHTVSAAYRDLYDSGGSLTSRGYERAKTAVTARLGFSASHLTQSGVLNLSAFGAYNHARSVTESVPEGLYRVAETWLCFDASGGAPAVEDYTVTTRSQAGRNTVSVEGTIQGLLQRDSGFAVSATKYANAATKWGVVQPLLLTRAQASSGLTLNPTPLSQQTARNELTGLVSYSAEYDDRYTYGDAVTLDVSLQDQNAADVFAAIPVVGRAAGPVLQDIGSSTETARTVTVSAQYPPGSRASGLPTTKPNLSALILNYRPSATQVFVARDEDQWNISSNSYSRTVTWVYQ